MCMTKKSGMGHVHINFVGFLQVEAGAQVALRGARVAQLMIAEPRSVRLHQGQRRGIPRSPHEHGVDVRGRQGAMLKDQLHARVNVVQSALVDLKAAIFHLVRHLSGHEGLAHPRLPAQSLANVDFFNTSCRTKSRRVSRCVDQST